MNFKRSFSKLLFPKILVLSSKDGFLLSMAIGPETEGGLNDFLDLALDTLLLIEVFELLRDLIRLIDLVSRKLILLSRPSLTFLSILCEFLCLNEDLWESCEELLLNFLLQIS